MKRIFLAFTFAIALSMVSIVYAPKNSTVSGEVVYSGDSKIYVCLLNPKAFAAAIGREKELPPPEFVQIVKANTSGKAPFAFRDVLKGAYVVRVFADENNNGKFDTDAMGFPIEPVGSYRRPQRGHFNWSEEKFEVDKDLTEMVVKLHE